ncbi:MAG: sulfatase-like hydrolase/transferase [Eubacterium sp.]
MRFDKETLKSKQMPKFKYDNKERLTIASLCSFAVCFVFLFFGPLDIYSNNKEEFAFTFYDLILPVSLIFLAGFAVLTAILYLFKGKLLNILSSLILTTVLYLFLDNSLFNKVNFVSGDIVNDGFQKEMVSSVLYVLVLSIVVFVSLAIGKKWKGIAIFLSVLILGMNGSGLISDFATKNLISDNSINCDYVLSEKNLYNVSEKENIVYFLFDRFDTDFYNEVVKESPEYFDSLEGFTYYDSAVSKYSRTFPGVSYMITGVEFDYNDVPQEHLTRAYEESDFLKDLKNNGYNINMYTNRYYEYRDAKVLLDICDNVEKADGYKVNKKRLLRYFYTLSFKRFSAYYLGMETYKNGNDGTVSKLSKIICEDNIYQDDDERRYEKLCENGLQYSGNDKNYTFIYLKGCHTPYMLDENCKRSPDATEVSQVKGSFKIIFDYIEEMKRLGVYDNSTIIISGDHGNPHSDTIAVKDFPENDLYDKGITTCILVKPRNSTNEKLKTSSAQVSVDDIIPFIVKDAGIKTNVDYGTPITDVGEDENRERIFYQSVYGFYDRKLVLNKYAINGDAHNLDNWTLAEEIKTDYSWY